MNSALVARWSCYHVGDYRCFGIRKRRLLWTMRAQRSQKCLILNSTILPSTQMSICIQHIWKAILSKSTAGHTTPSTMEYIGVALQLSKSLMKRYIYTVKNWCWVWRVSLDCYMPFYSRFAANFMSSFCIIVLTYEHLNVWACDRFGRVNFCNWNPYIDPPPVLKNGHPFPTPFVLCDQIVVKSLYIQGIHSLKSEFLFVVSAHFSL